MSSEIRDKVKGKIADILWTNWRNLGNRHQAEVFKNVDQILSIEGLAIVDREVELPEREFISSNENYRYKEAQQDMLNDHWVKEIKT